MSIDKFNPNMTAADYDQRIIDRISDVTEFSPGFRSQHSKDMLLRYLASSHSLNLEEKHKVWMSIPELSYFQVDRLLRVFEEEENTFSEITQENWKKGAALWGECWKNIKTLLAMLFLDLNVNEEHCILMAMIEKKYHNTNNHEYIDEIVKSAPQDFRDWYYAKQNGEEQETIPDII
jgi:hypothetical protein